MATKESGVAAVTASDRNSAGGGNIATAKGLRLRFFIVFVGLAVGPILFVGLFLGQNGYSTVTQESQRSLDSMGVQVRDNVTTFFKTITQELTTAGTIAVSGTLAPARRAAILQFLLLRHNSYQDIYLLDHRGTVVEWFSRTAVSATVNEVSFGEAPIFKVPAATLRPYLGEIRIDPAMREPLVSLSIPFADPYSGKLRHILMVNIRFKSIWNLLAEMENEEGVEAYVVNSAGRIVAHRNPTVAMRGTHIGVGAASDDKLLKTREVLSTEQRALVHGTDLTVVVQKDLAVAHRFANRFVWTTVGVSIVALAIAVIFFLLYERGIIAPLGRLLTSVDGLRKGNYPDTIDVGGYGEVGILSDSFAKMIGELKSAKKQVQKSMGNLEEKNTQLSVKIEELKASEARANAASHAKTDFLATMSHELRTPLNAVIGFSEIIRTESMGPVGSPQYREYATDIHESGQHLLTLINDLLDMAKVESGKDELHEERVHVPELIRSIAMLLRGRAKDAGVEFEYEIEDSSTTLRADERKVKQILLNLLTNAIKFTESGGRVTIKAWSSLKSGYVIQIADTGIGIAPDDIPKALSQFGQIDGQLNRRHEGTGLGLPLSKALVELHGGSLNLQSEVGVGTTLTVRFPASRIETPDLLQQNSLSG